MKTISVELRDEQAVRLDRFATGLCKGRSEHISPKVCSIVRDLRPQILIEPLLGFTDDSRLLQDWAAKGLSHQGVIFLR